MKLQKFNSIKAEKPEKPIESNTPKVPGVHQPWTYPHMRYFAPPDNKRDKVNSCIHSDEYFAQRKWDGASYMFTKDSDGNMGLYSRAISKKTGFFSEKSENVPHIMKQLAKLPNETVVIGEIAYPDGISSNTTEIMGCLPEKAAKRNAEKPIHYYIFDILFYDGECLHTKPAIYRVTKLYSIFKELELESDTVHYVDFVTGGDEIQGFLSQILAEGGEGIVLKKKMAKYEIDGSRPAWNTIKIKQQTTCDVVVTGTVAPTKEYLGKYAEDYPYRDEEGNPVNRLWYHGWINAFEIGLYIGGELKKIGTVASGLNDAIREDAATNPEKYIGRVIECSCMSIDHDNQTMRHPRFIRFRDDKIAKECECL